MNTVTITRTFVVALVLVLTATGLWAAVPDLVMYALEQYWTIYGPLLPQFSVNQPWLIGYNGEMILSGGRK